MTVQGSSDQAFIPFFFFDLNQENIYIVKQLAKNLIKKKNRKLCEWKKLKRMMGSDKFWSN